MSDDALLILKVGGPLIQSGPHEGRSDEVVAVSANDDVRIDPAHILL